MEADDSDDEQSKHLVISGCKDRIGIPEASRQILFGVDLHEPTRAYGSGPYHDPSEDANGDETE